MGQGRINGKYTRECIEWCVEAYNGGMLCSEIARMAQIEFPDLYASFNKNCVLGIVHRSGKLKRSKTTMRDSAGSMAAVITLPGPAWVIEAMANKNVRGVSHV
jgi:hypothetical protein